MGDTQEIIQECAEKECRVKSGDRFAFCNFQVNENYHNIKIVNLSIADDFSYENGVFTFDKTSLINYLEKVLEINDEATLTLISNFINLILTKFEISIKYDGEKFTSTSEGEKVTLTSWDGVIPKSETPPVIY